MPRFRPLMRRHTGQLSWGQVLLGVRRGGEEHLHGDEHLAERALPRRGGVGGHMDGELRDTCQLPHMGNGCRASLSMPCAL